MVKAKIFITKSHKNFIVGFHISGIWGIELNNTCLSSLTLELATNVRDVII